MTEVKEDLIANNNNTPMDPGEYWKEAFLGTGMSRIGASAGTVIGEPAEYLGGECGHQHSIEALRN